MTGTTRNASLHLLHGNRLGIAIGINLSVTVRTLINRRVELMAEMADDGTFFVFVNFLCRQLEAGMTLGTVTPYGESSLAVMADAAGFSLLHLGHGGPFVLFLVWFYHCRVAILTAVGLGMKSVAEDGFGHRWCCIAHFGTLVASATLINLKSLFTVMTETTRFAFFHFRHGDSGVLPCFV